ncbi:MAG: GHMP kinase [Nitrospiraceae bacterium]|nr:GHMP kinase [Nitrospiraceae bacterium]
MICEGTAYARAGLVGNPSDGYFGKTISIIIRDWAAKVTLYESPELEIVPSFQDRSKYGSLRELREDVISQGYYGGIRLMKATIRKFLDYCERHDIALADRNFSIRYRSTVPNRVGLSGSSALVTATLRALMEFYEVSIPEPVQPGLILSVETEELGIAAGLQDRVIQVYEDCVFMDFDRAVMEAQGHGNYERLDPGLLPNLFIAYQTDLAEGSEVFHNNIRERWLEGDPEIVQAMQDFASYAQESRDLIVAGRGSEIGPCLDQNFDRRASISNLDPRNVDMVMRARSTGAPCKFAGSGGAVVGLYEDDGMYRKLEKAYQGTGVVVLKPSIHA